MKVRTLEEDVDIDFDWKGEMFGMIEAAKQ